MIGKTISHYNILEKLGEGGMGVVHKARDTHLDRFVAIKVLPAEKVADPERKQRFVQEAKAASSLNHPNIITIYDIGQAEGVDFISMEFVNGKTLDQLIPRRGMRLNEALKCAVQIADALARAHSAGIVHRDLKPGNIMVNEHGLVKVLDFGLAKLTEANPTGEDDATRTMRPTTEEGKIVGTVSYMSPEQAEGKKVDARSDIFSFGSGPGQKPGLPFRFIASTQIEDYPAFSPDGRRIAFESERSGTQEIWICDSDGSKTLQLTSFGGAAIYGPSWSPDSQNIAFTVAQEGVKDDVYVVSVNGGVPRRMTTDPAEDKWPYWSHDGMSIYFSSTRSGREEIWKMPSAGVEAIQITRNSGDRPQESADGKFLYYIKGWPEAVSVWRAEVDGNQEAKVLDSVHTEGQWTVGKEGIYFFRTPDKIGHSDICFYEFATGQIRKVLTIQHPVYDHIAVSPDGRTILYPQSDESGSILMLVENFR